MCDIYGEETSTLWLVSHPKARVEHRCACCHSTVPRGDYYALTRSLYDGSWQTEKACAGCATAIHAFGEEHRFTPEADTFVEYLEDCIRGDDDEWVPVLAGIMATRYPRRAAKQEVSP